MSTNMLSYLTKFHPHPAIPVAGGKLSLGELPGAAGHPLRRAGREGPSRKVTAGGFSEWGRFAACETVKGSPREASAEGEFPTSAKYCRIRVNELAVILLNAKRD